MSEDGSRASTPFGDEDEWIGEINDLKAIPFSFCILYKL